MKKISSIIVLFFVSIFIHGQCPTTPPTGHDSCRIGTGSVTLRASGSSGYYHWYDAATGGSFLGAGTTYSTPSISSNTNYYVSAAEPPSSLIFDGTNDYIALNMSYTNTGEIPVLTVEAWVNTTFSGGSWTGNWAIIDFDRSEYYNLYIRGDNGQVGFSTTGSNGAIHDFYSGAGNTVNDGNWHHIAAVYDGTDKVIYIDGVEVARDNNSHGGRDLGSGTNRFGFIGDGSEAGTFNAGRNNIYYEGAIDEVRIWHTVRSATEISNNRNTCLSGSETNLAAYYSFNETSGTTLNDITGNGNTGTLFNFNTAVAWSSDAPFSCGSCETARVLVTAMIGIGTPLNLVSDTTASCNQTSLTLDAGTGYANYLWSTTATSSSINVNNSGTYWVQVDDGVGCYDSDTINVKIANGPARTALNFDGTNDYASIANFSYASSSITEVTVEAWINTTNGADQIIASFDRSDYWRLGINGNGAGTGQVAWNVLTNTGIFDFGSTRRVDDGEWHHVVGVFDNGVISIYIDGVLDAQTTSGSVMGSGATRFGFVGIGSEANSFNGTTGPNNEFRGDMDEFRIWSRALSQDEIRDNMCTSFTGNMSGLEVYYDFNDGTGTTITDIANNNNATMRNMDPTTDWVASGAPVGNKSVYLYPGSWGGQTLSITSCDGDEITIENVIGTPSGIHLYVVEEDPTEQTNIIGFASGNHYYGIFQTHGSGGTYDLTYTYTNHPLSTSVNESSLYLLDRNDGSSASWNNSSASLNTTTNELTVNHTGTVEVILDANESVWTGATSTDWNTGSNWQNGIVPTVGATILIPDVTNDPVLDMNRTIGGLTIESNASLDLNNANLSISGHFLLDGTVTANNGTLTFNGANAQDLLLNTLLDAENITINNAAGVTTQNGAINLHGRLTLTNGNFETNNSLTLISDATGTASIAEITGGSISGEITMQRYVDAGATNWRFFSPPVSGATLADWNDDFITSGFTGSDFPFFIPNGWVTIFTSIYFYDETVTGILDNGYVAATNVTNSVAVGEGLWIWCGDTITGTDPFTVDITGPPNTGTINLPVTYTNSGSATDDGWNMVGNPYPASIDWDDASITKTNINNAIYIWNPDLEQFASYVGGIGTNGGSNNIASSQAFWVQTNATSPILQVTEAAKTTTDAAFLKTRNKTSVNPLIINVSNASGSDQTIVNFQEEASLDFDPQWDAYKFASSNYLLPSISSFNNNTEFSINQFPEQEITIPVKVTTGNTGTHIINFQNLALFADYSCLIFEDRFNGNQYDLHSTDSIELVLYDTTQSPRFNLFIGAKNSITVTPPSCHDIDDAQITFTRNTPHPFSALWKNNNGDTISYKPAIDQNDMVINIAPGRYTVESSNNNCDNHVTSVYVPVTPEIKANFSTNRDTTFLSQNGSVEFFNHSSSANQYYWNFDDGHHSSLTSPSYQFESEGAYNVVLKAYNSSTCFDTTSMVITVINDLITTNIDNINPEDIPSKAWVSENKVIIKPNYQNADVTVRNIVGELLFHNPNVNNQTFFKLGNLSSQTIIIFITPHNSSVSEIIKLSVVNG